MKLFNNIKHKAINFLGGMIPNNSRYQSGFFGFGSLTAIWTSKAADEYYSSVPELFGIIERKVAMFMKVQIDFKNAKNETVEHPFLKLIEKPNPF